LEEDSTQLQPPADFLKREVVVVAAHYTDRMSREQEAVYRASIDQASRPGNCRQFHHTPLTPKNPTMTKPVACHQTTMFHHCEMKQG